ncbi:MAG: 23S rRNA (adenine(2503)-C(2))-methyltransferase RlmN [Myxococcota bacterium]|nr:23S rRNA (adenine(2503)-C(2))-methyltransferase RlmN [Myxococcota bacterium]
MVAARSTKTNLLGLSPTEMLNFIVGLGGSKNRANECLRSIHQHGVGHVADMKTMGAQFRAHLEAHAEIRVPNVLSCHDSDDGTRKWIVETAHGGRVETVYIPHGDRGTLCVSSQVGCSLDCRFCSTGRQGFESNLSPAEIIGQLWIAQASLGGFVGSNRPISNVVFMGMGEPLLNFNAVVSAVRLMQADTAYGLSRRRITISTSGVVPALFKLGEHVNVALALSLHAPNDALRSQIVPLNDKYPIGEVLDACRQYRDSWGSRRDILVEYVLLAGVNDQPVHAEELAELLRDFPAKINLIPFNPFPNSGFRRPAQSSVDRFWRILTERGFVVTSRATRGDDIRAACGQLVGTVNDRTRRREKHAELLVIEEPVG